VCFHCHLLIICETLDNIKSITIAGTFNGPLPSLALQGNLQTLESWSFVVLIEIDIAFGFYETLETAAVTEVPLT
jgi:hypothetical protein